jgi:RNA polymerase sigma-70 factor (ECF subfamily)
MFVDDGSKETSVSLSANILSTGDLMEFPARSIAAEASDAFEDLATLFRDHYKAIFRVSYRVTGSMSDAEDVLQTIFLRLSSGGHRAAISPNPQAYFYRAAINASLDLLRQRKRANAVQLDVIGTDNGPRAAGNPEDELVDVELKELLRQAVAQLEGRAAAAFVLRYYEGHDNARIAEILGTSPMVVAVTLHRARTRLRKEIGNYLEKHHEAA